MYGSILICKWLRGNEIVCFECGEYGHRAEICPKKEASSLVPTNPEASKEEEQASSVMLAQTGEQGVESGPSSSPV